MQPKIIYILLLTTLVISCEKDIKLNLSGNENLLVVNSIISPDKPISFHLTRSVSILDKDTVIAVEKAKIEIFCDNILLETDSAGNNGTFTSAVYPQPGKLYSVKINSPNLPQISASALVPNYPSIQSINTESLFHLTLNDDLSKKCYYLFYKKGYIIYYVNEQGNFIETEKFDFLPFTNKTPVLNDFNTTTANETINLILGESNVNNVEFVNWMAFSNEYFTQNFHEIIVSSGYYRLNETKPIYIYLSKISEDYFKYLKTKELNKKVGNSPFSEPVQIFNNIDGGIGIFGGMTTVVDSIFINPQN